MEVEEVPKTQCLSSDTVARYVSEIRQALVIRLVEERLLSLFSEGRLFGTIHTCIGQEFVGVAVSKHLCSEDYVFSNHRCHGHFISRYNDVEGLISEIMGKSSGVCAGLGGSQHLCQDRFFSNGIQGGIVPIAAGLGYASKLDSKNAISVVFIGDGTLGEGVVYETLNIISKWDIPLLMLLENNLYSQSTKQEDTLSGSISARFRAFDIECMHSNTWEWPELIEDMQKSVEFVRSNQRPMFHLVDTYRLMAHSKGDDNRPGEIVRPYVEKDPINRILEGYCDETWLREMVSDIRLQIDRAVRNAESAPFHQLDPIARATRTIAWGKRSFSKKRINVAIRESLQEALRENKRVCLLGEDIESPYGGAFKVTCGLSDEFGARVRNTPISEGAITGLGNGLALGGYIPVVEIMFGDFITLSADQWINHSSKFKGMYNNKVNIPFIIRTPMGGRRGYGPTHSQSIEKLFIGCPDTRVLCLHHRFCPAEIYRELFKTIDRPTLVVENKLLYTQYADPVAPNGFELLHTDDVFPITWLRPKAQADITMLAIGGMSLDCEKSVLQLFDQNEIIAELFLPTQLYPFDAAFLTESLLKTQKLIVVEEGQGFASMSSEIITQVSENPQLAGTLCRRMTASPNPIPTSRPLEEKCLPSAESVVQLALEMVNV